MRSLIYLVLMVVIAIVAASLTVEVYGKCGEGWWWKGKDWCAVDYVRSRLEPLQVAPAPEPEPPKPKPKGKAKG